MVPSLSSASAALALAFWVAVASSCMTHPDTPAYRMPLPALDAPASGVTRTEAAFLAVPTNTSARASLEHITSKPHVAGTPGDHDMALYVQQQFKHAGIEDAVIDPQRVLLAYPKTRSLSLVDSQGHAIWTASLSEDVLASDSTSDTWWRNHTFNGYSPSGDETAPVVYANFGLPEDFEALAEAGVSVTGAVVLMRYGKCFRGLKAMNAEAAGAVGAIIYSDPAQDGFAKGAVYPEGPWRPKSSVQRGSIQFISVCAGDPSRAYAPQNKSVEEVCGKSQKELIPQIPVLPISWGDAVPILRALGGPAAPPAFHGALNLSSTGGYRLGPTPPTLHARMVVNNTFQKSAVWNVIARIPGTLPAEEDQPVILGNHRDAWVFGAADPNSGTAQLIEIAKGFGSLLASGWRPQRTILLTSWSGEEYGLLGSTAWGEVNGDGDDDPYLLSRALAYLNVDVGVSGQVFGASATPSLGSALHGVLQDVTDPSSGRPLSEQWSGDLYALGSGSDYTVFIDHLGIASVDMHFSPGTGTYGVYHSTFDSFEWMTSVGDPQFLYHVAMAQLWGLLALRLAGGAEAGQGGDHGGLDGVAGGVVGGQGVGMDMTMPIPFNCSLQADAIAGYITDLRRRTNATSHGQIDLSALTDAHAAFASAAVSTMAEAEQAATASPGPAREKLVRAVNGKLGLVERQFLSTAGLPGRKWFRHTLQAPGLYTGYAPQTFPGIAQAVDAGKWDTAQEQVEVAAARIRAAAQFLEQH